VGGEGTGPLGLCKRDGQSAERNWKKSPASPHSATGKKPSKRRIQEGSKHHDARKDERKSVRVASQADRGGGGHNVPSSVAREGRVDPLGDRVRRGTLTKPLAHGSDSGVRGGTCLVCCCHTAASSQGFARARGSAAYSSIDRRAGSVRLDSSAQRNLQQCKQGDAQRDARDTERRLELTNTSLKPRPQ